VIQAERSSATAEGGWPTERPGERSEPSEAPIPAAGLALVTELAFRLVDRSPWPASRGSPADG